MWMKRDTKICKTEKQPKFDKTLWRRAMPGQRGAFPPYKETSKGEQCIARCEWFEYVKEYNLNM